MLQVQLLNENNVRTTFLRNMCVDETYFPGFLDDISWILWAQWKEIKLLCFLFLSKFVRFEDMIKFAEGAFSISFILHSNFNKLLANEKRNMKTHIIL